MRVAEGEVARVRETQAGTKTWLGEVTESVAALRGELAAVEEMKPTVESVRADSDRLSQSMAQIESRRQLVEQLNKIGRASCRERVDVAVVGVSIKREDDTR